MKTIQQVADELGISHWSVRQRIEMRRMKVEKVKGGVIALTDEQVAKIATELPRGKRGRAMVKPKAPVEEKSKLILRQPLPSLPLKKPLPVAQQRPVIEDED